MILIFFTVILSNFRQFILYNNYFNNKNPFPFIDEINNLLTTQNNSDNNITLNNSTVLNNISNYPLIVNSSCLITSLGDGKCDDQNNNANCNWDLGDCCSSTCNKNCKKGNCIYKCGTINPYNCINGVDCQKCSGFCNNMASCLSDDNSIKKMVYNFLNNI